MVQMCLKFKQIDKINEIHPLATACFRQKNIIQNHMVSK